MKKLLVFILISCLQYATSASADEFPKNLQVGFGTYAVVVANDDPFYDDDTLGGTNIAVRVALDDNFALHANFYSTTHDDFSDLDNDGMDLIAYFGRNMQSQGTRFYAGGGIYRETWKEFGFEADFNGIQISGGIGHAWENFAIDFILSLRETSDYEDLSGGSANLAAASGGLILSARF